MFSQLLCKNEKNIDYIDILYSVQENMIWKLEHALKI